MSKTATAGASSGGLGVGNILGVAFVILKLVGKIDWSWWYVTMPFWIGWAIFGGIAVLTFVVGAVVVIIQTLLRRRGRRRF